MRASRHEREAEDGIAFSLVRLRDGLRLPYMPRHYATPFPPPPSLLPLAPPQAVSMEPESRDHARRVPVHQAYMITAAVCGRACELSGWVIRLSGWAAQPMVAWFRSFK